MYLLQLVKNINHELTIKLECLSISLSTLLFHLFLLELFPSKENAKIKKIFIVFSSLFSFFVIVSPIRIYNKCLGVLHTVIIFSAGYFISYLLYRIIRSKERFSLLLVGSLFFVITVINDILYYYALTSTGSLTSVGLLFFLVTCYLTVYKQYRRSYYGTNEITKYNTNWDKTQAQNNKIFFAESIVEYSKSLTSNIELNEVLKLLLVKLKSFIFFNSGIVVLREGETFKVISSVGCLSPDIDGLLIKELSDDQLIKSIMEGRQPLVLGNLGKKLPYPCIFRNDEEEKSFLAVPIVKNDKVLGIVVLKSKQENAYTDYDAEIVYNFLAQSGIAIENAKLFAEVKKLAVEDELTKIYNRRYFFELAEREFKLHKRYKELKLLSVVMLDIDDFKNINDTYGHYAGDKVLKIVAKKCKESLRETDLIGRYGGEEFAILLPHTEKQEAAIVVERLRKSIADCRIPYGDRIISITVSIGLAVMDERMQTLDQLMIKADEALYIAKSNGKNCIISL